MQEHWREMNKKRYRKANIFGDFFLIQILIKKYKNLLVLKDSFPYFDRRSNN